MALSPQEEAVLQELLARRKPEQPTSKSIYFFNWTNKDFTHTWDSTPYTVKAGEKMLMQDWLARHLAKHLAERELNEKNDVFVAQQKAQGKEGKNIKEINILFTPDRERYVKMALGEIAFEAADDTELEVLMGNSGTDSVIDQPEEVKPIEAKKKAGRPAKKKVEEEFEGLKDIKNETSPEKSGQDGE